ncbi:MAG TPA: hypothetical protein PKM43_22145 [Verrucomicrobiota bacterium]|nr:hypothetical protein [Verrucomicrobiota bacterium]HRZ58412.1 hypothetical protein [Candidatus Paceibacterota bacterium]
MITVAQFLTELDRLQVQFELARFSYAALSKRKKHEFFKAEIARRAEQLEEVRRRPADQLKEL